VGILRLVALIAIVLFAIAWLLRWVAGARRAPAPDVAPPMRGGARHSFELRCEKHGLTVRLEADGGDSFERARLQVRCPLCAQERASGE
jgi:hypothetical protein